MAPAYTRLTFVARSDHNLTEASIRSENTRFVAVISSAASRLAQVMSVAPRTPSQSMELTFRSSWAAFPSASRFEMDIINTMCEYITCGRVCLC